LFFTAVTVVVWQLPTRVVEKDEATDAFLRKIYNFDRLYSKENGNTMSRWKLIKDIVSDGLYILKNQRKYSDLELAKAKRIKAEQNLSMLKQKLQQEEMELQIEKKNAINELNRVKQIKEDLMKQNQDILDSFDNQLGDCNIDIGEKK
jgi:hypothetical protein